MSDVFPAVGHKYLVDFKADDGNGGFKVQLDFHSETSMTYTGVKANGDLDPSNVETVVIKVDPIRDMLFLVTWTEKEGAVIVHLEDYKEYRIITNYVDPGPPPKLTIYRGPMKQIS
jgi:hypothetical protein